MDKVELIFKDAISSECALNKLFKREFRKTVAENAADGLAEYQFFADCSKYETDDMFGTPKKIEHSGHCVWVSDVWVWAIPGSRIPEIVKSKLKDGRFPVRTVSLWYTPYCYMNTGMDVDELYRKSETEKVLYEDFDVKISMVRRNVIPFFKSVQYCHKISKHEYVFYLKRRKSNKKIEGQLDVLRAEAQQYDWGTPERTKLAEKIKKLSAKLSYWHECFHADTLKSLKTTAKHYFNEWYTNDY